MLFSAKHQRNNRVSATSKNKTLNKVSSISSSSSPSRTQDSPSQKRSLVTMEDVWKDINLGSIHSQRPQGNHEPRFGSHSHQNQNPNSIFQDFLNRPLNQEQTIPTMGSSSGGDTTTVTALTTTVTALLSSSPLAPPATVLSLNPGPGFEFLDNQDPLVTPNYNHLNTSFEALVTPTCFGKRRGEESHEEGTGNRRNKRMIKNRESAARSRARKQECASLSSPNLLLEKRNAYTNELELKVAQLQAENARLMRQQDQLRIAAENQQQPKKNTLQRASTAPF
ncbi:bZIP transcription factor 27 [Hirschfeldia incana]|nr:bZIP transcription factor 27 [Hirschfeldia incana]